MSNPLPLPVSDPIARPRRSGYGEDRPDPQEGFITDSWQQALTSLTTTISQQPVRTTAVTLLDQTGSIVATNLGTGATTTGLYRATYYVNVTVPAAGFTLTVEVGWTDRGSAWVLDGPTVDTLGGPFIQSGSLMVKADASTPITYSTTVTGLPITYDFSIVLETISV